MQNLLEKLGLGERATSMVVWVGLSLLLLIIVVALAVWLVRTLRPTLNMSGGSGRGGRPQRLAITDAFTLDREGRKLVIVRRDNVEHLLLIGGPNDVLVESSIVRGERSARDRAGRVGADSELLAAENALAGDAPATPVAPQAPMVAPPPAPIAPPVFRPAPPPVAKPVPPAAAPRMDDDFERALSAMQNAQRQQAAAPPAPPAPPRPPQPAPAAFTPPPAPMPAPPVAAPVQTAPMPPPLPAPLPPVMAEPVPMPPPPPLPEPPARSQPVSEMARRLNEVLQKPLSGTLRPPFNKPIPPVPGTMNSAPKPPPPALPVEAEIPLAPPPPLPPAPPPVPQPPAPASPAPVAGKPGSDHEMDLLEEEMARLLGRPSQPKKPDAP